MFFPNAQGTFSNIVHMLNLFSRVQLFATLRTVAHQAPLSKGFSRREYCSGYLCLPPGDLPDPGIKASFLPLLHCQAGSLPLVAPRKPGIIQ